MKTIKINLYKFDELSEEAKEKAFKEWENKNFDQEYSWSHEAMESLKKGLQHFGVELKNWSIDFLEPGRNEFKLDLPYDHEDWTGENSGEYLDILVNDMGEFNAENLKGVGECKFTGYCMDENFADGVREAYFKENERDLRELMISGINSWETAVQNDAEYQYSEEYFQNEARELEWEFEADGSRWE